MKLIDGSFTDGGEGGRRCIAGRRCIVASLHRPAHPFPLFRHFVLYTSMGCLVTTVRARQIGVEVGVFSKIPSWFLPPVPTAAARDTSKLLGGRRERTDVNCSVQGLYGLRLISDT